jgi:hypothetical protein
VGVEAEVWVCHVAQQPVGLVRPLLTDRGGALGDLGLRAVDGLLALDADAETGVDVVQPAAQGAVRLLARPDPGGVAGCCARDGCVGGAVAVGRGGVVAGAERGPQDEGEDDQAAHDRDGHGDVPATRGAAGGLVGRARGGRAMGRHRRRELLAWKRRLCLELLPE